MQALLRTFIEHGNQFGECGHLYDLETGLVAKQNVENYIKRLKSVGQEQYITFVNERLRASQDAPEGELCIRKINTPMTKNQLKLLSHNASKKKRSAAAGKIKMLKAEYSFFSKCSWHVSAEKGTL